MSVMFSVKSLKIIMYVEKPESTCDCRTPYPSPQFDMDPQPLGQSHILAGDLPLMQNAWSKLMLVRQLRELIKQTARPHDRIEYTVDDVACF